MGFYQKSTGKEAAPGDTEKSYNPPGQMGFVPLANQVQVSRYYVQIMQLSNSLTRELIRNNYLLQAQQSLVPPAQPDPLKDSERNSTSSGSGNSEVNFQTLKSQRMITSHPPARKHSRIHKNRPKRLSHDEDESSYKPDGDDSKEEWHCKISESKNIPKNYGKAVINFIRRNEEYVRQVVEHLGLGVGEFEREVGRLKTNLNTILQLREMWTEGPFAQALRIITMEYLRKHSFSYIFNSRVENFHKHIKYRYKIIESVAHPETFTCMKEF